MRYAATAADWDRVVAICRAAGKVGIDSETYGHDILKTSAAHRARIHVWSLAVKTQVKHARGFFRASGVMLPVEALEHRPVVELLEDPEVVKLAHNLPHDHHAFRNHGITLRGALDTLPRARLTLTDEASHGLKPLMERCLMRQVTSFEDVLREPNVVTVVRRKVEKGCICGAQPWCKRRGVNHVRVTWKRFHPELLTRGTRLMRLEDVRPGHPRFELLTSYAIQDAEGVLELEDYLNRRDKAPVAEVPWS